jgi:hypothetical protein
MMPVFELKDDDEQTVARFMSHLAALSAEGCAIDPMRLWWKAQLLQRRDAARRAQLPLDVMEAVHMAVAAAMAGFILVWSLPSALRAFTP